MTHKTHKTHKNTWLVRHPMIILLIICILLAGSIPETIPPTQAQIPPISGSITGTITQFGQNQTGEPSVTINLYRLNLDGSRTLLTTTTTANNGSYSFNNVGSGRYLLIPGKQSGPTAYTFTPSSINVFLRGSQTKTFVSHKPTIVAIGGWLGTAGMPKNCSVITYDPAICPEDLFDAYSGQPNRENLINELRNAGYHVETASLDSSSIGTPPIRSQVPILTAAIDRAVAATGASKVVIIAHSMGGIVARRYIEGNNYRQDVSHLFTLGSPHRGAFLIDSVISLIALTSPPFGAAISAAGAAGLCGVHPAACDVSSTGMALYNLSTPPNNSVTYHIIHGDSIQSDSLCGIFFNPPCDSNDAKLTFFGTSMDAAMTAFTLGQGVDPFISTDSINGVSGSRDRLKTHDAHDTSMGNPWYMTNVTKVSNGKIISRRSQTYTNCFKPVFLDRSSTRCGTIRSPNVPVLAQTENELPFQHVPSITGTLLAGEQMTRTVQLVSNDETAQFFTHWNTGTLTMKVQTPDGTLIDPTFALSATDTLTYTSSDTSANYTLYSPKTYGLGRYTVILEATDAPAGGITFETSAVFPSGYTFTATRNRNWYPPNEVATFTATFSGTALTDMHVTGVVKQTNGTSEPITLNQQTPSTFTLAYTIPNSPGYTSVDLIATGTTPQGSIERVRSFQFQVYPNSFVPTGQFQSTLVPALPVETRTDEDEDTSEVPITAGSDLVIQVEVQSPVAGAGRVSGILSDAEGTVLLTSTSEATIAANTPTLVDLRFSGAELLAAGRPGPYTLSRLIVIDERAESLVSADITNVVTTPVYTLNDFMPKSQLYLPLIAR